MTSKLTKLTDDELTETLRLATSGYPLPACVEGNLRQAFAELQERRKAAMDSEPVAWLAIYHGEVYDDAIGITRSVVEAQADRFGWESALTEIIPLDRHAQQLVVPKIATADDFGGLSIAKAYGWNACRAAMLQAGTFRENGNSSTNNFREITETSTNSPALSPSREHFISLCNEFWGWSDMDMICADDKGYEPRLEWNGQSFTHPVTRGLWRMYQAAPTGIPMNSNGWIPVSERMPEKNQNVLISVNFDSSLVEPLICSARYTGSTFRRGEATVKPGSGIEQVTHWMPLPAAPQEVNHG